MGNKKLHIATTNSSKLGEFKEILEPLGYVVCGIGELDFDVVEDGDTFAANSIKKAAALSELTGEMAIADDSGLVVDALEGKPGIHSARYAADDYAAQWAQYDRPKRDEINRKKLLKTMEKIGSELRSARFTCALALCVPGAEAVVFHGNFEGSITDSEKGDGGFGYDQIFQVAAGTKTSAELTALEKNSLSHRGQAIKKLVAYLEKNN